MRYVMRQRLWAFGDDFTIKDDNGRDAFFIDGRIFSIGDKLSFQNTHGQEEAFIQQKLLAWGPTYEVYRSGQLAATVRKALFTVFRARFSIDVPGPDDLEAQGDFLDYEYAFQRAGQPVAQVSKQWFSWSDTYGIDIAEGEDDVLILASAVVIDMASHDETQRSE